MQNHQKELVLRYQPHIYADKKEPFPIRYIGCSVFTEPGESPSWRGLNIDPRGENAAVIIEYAVYYDYDIQHLYDLEHIWVAVGADGTVQDCWCSFHGMRLRAAGISSFRLNGTHPVIYAQPGKHAMLPHPELFELHPQFHTACGKNAGGGLLIPPMLAGKMVTDEVRDAKVKEYICSHFAFEPSLDFEPHPVEDSQFISWPELLDRIPELMETQLKIIE